MRFSVRTLGQPSCVLEQDTFAFQTSGNSQEVVTLSEYD